MSTILNLDKRLETIVSLCDKHKVIADIGCDHGLVTAELILQEKAERVISTEISPDCLNKAITLANRINILPFISFRECDGFKLVTKYDKVNQAVIAGLGGKKIIEIMENKPKRLWNFVLQPMNDVVELRRYLLANHYRFVIDELLYDDGKYYNVIKVAKGKQKMSELEIQFGFSNFRENYEVLYKYLKEKQTKLTTLKERFGLLNDENEQMLVYVNEALALFEPKSEEDKQAEQEPVQEEQTQEENSEQPQESTNSAPTEESQPAENKTENQD